MQVLAKKTQPGEGWVKQQRDTPMKKARGHETQTKI